MPKEPLDYRLGRAMERKLGVGNWATAAKIEAIADVEEDGGYVWSSLQGMVRNGAAEREQRGKRNSSGVPVESYRLLSAWREKLPEKYDKQTQAEYWGELDNDQDTFDSFV